MKIIFVPLLFDQVTLATFVAVSLDFSIFADSKNRKS
jgi:hypothetical protein